MQKKRNMDEQGMYKTRREKAYEQGKQAFADYKPMTVCHYTKDTSLRAYWDQGWLDAMEEEKANHIQVTGKA